MPTPFSSSFDAFRLNRVQVTGSGLVQTLDWRDQSGRRYFFDANPGIVASRAIGSEP